MSRPGKEWLPVALGVVKAANQSVSDTAEGGRSGSKLEMPRMGRRKAAVRGRKGIRRGRGRNMVVMMR